RIPLFRTKRRSGRAGQTGFFGQSGSAPAIAVLDRSRLRHYGWLQLHGEWMSVPQMLPGSTDCHLHIFGPTARYPYTANRAYTPPEASLASYNALPAIPGLQRLVIVLCD